MPNLIKAVNFSTSRTGLATVAYTLINTDGSTKQARTTTGVFEVLAGTGIYACLISFTAAWEGIILWDDGQVTKRYALDVHWKSNITDEIADAILDEDITTYTTANTVGARLNAIFQYIRSGPGGGIITRQAGALTDEDKDKILLYEVQLYFTKFNFVNFVNFVGVGMGMLHHLPYSLDTFCL